jgi:hypothetical protein
VQAKYGREVRKKREVPEGHRYCPGCDCLKSVDQFVRTKAKTSGFHTYCKTCHKQQVREAAGRLYGGMREYHLRYRYGIGQMEFDELLAAQGGMCAICGKENPQHVDHDHVTGYIRGILCFNCNGGLGHFRDNIAHMTKATAYLMTTASWAEEGPGVYRVLTPQRGMHPKHLATERRGTGTSGPPAEPGD